MRLFIRERARLRASRRTWCGRCRSSCRPTTPHPRRRSPCAWRSPSTTPWRAIAMRRASTIRLCTCRRPRCLARRSAAAQPGDRSRRRDRRGALARLPDAEHRSHDALVRPVGAGRRRRRAITCRCKRFLRARPRRRRARRGSRTKSVFAIRGTVVVNAAGPWAAQPARWTCRPSASAPPPRLSRA